MSERDERHEEEGVEEGPSVDGSEASASSGEAAGDSVPDGSTRAEGESTEAASSDSERLYFFPEDGVDEAELRAILESGDLERRAWAISHLLRYAQWDDIWDYIERDTVREIFPHLDLPENLRSAWARMLKIEVSVS